MDRKIVICENISTRTAQRVCNQLEELAYANPGEDIYLFINSYGGCVASMLAIVAMMQRIPNDVVTIVNGKAMSAGAFIAAFGTKGKRFAFNNAQFMYHEPNGFAELTAKGIESMAWTKEYTTRLLAEQAELSISEMEEMIDRDFYIFAHDLQDHRGSFIDGIVGY